MSETRPSRKENNKPRDCKPNYNGGLTSVDVQVINEAPLLVQSKVVQQGVSLYERDRARRVASEMQTRKPYFDFAPVARRLAAAFLDKVHRGGLLYG